MAEHFADRFLDAIEAKQAPVVVGLDPVYNRMPKQIREIAAKTPQGLSEQSSAALEFCRSIIDIVSDLVPAVKLQSAHFEMCGPSGLEALYRVTDYAHQQGLIVILDAKRGDIGSTAEAYASAYLEEIYFGKGEEEKVVTIDAITVNPYFGADGVQPFIDVARRNGAGVFVMVRSSNSSANEFQGVVDASGRRLFEVVAERVNEWANQPECVGQSGYSLVGAIVSATYPEDAKLLREAMPNSIFLVPGYGAQGATGDDAVAAFHEDGWGAVINATRSVIYAWERPEYEHLGEVNWEEAVELAVRDMRQDISEAMARRVSSDEETG
ncbi:MAG: orotidine-5'-phosphate decarboxylase [Planctomycetia bacterium]|nr:orotidine-5'-phosphate decarboxylase [Planctomycetia bacterium]